MISLYMQSNEMWSIALNIFLYYKERTVEYNLIKFSVQNGKKVQENKQKVEDKFRKQEAANKLQKQKWRNIKQKS